MTKALENVRRIYMEGIAGGNARAAVLACTGHRYTQHSTGVADGAEGFLAFFEPFLARNPKRDIRLVKLFQDGRWVFCSAYQSLNEGAAQWVTMDMFYTDTEGLILEHWDTIAPYEAQIASEQDMVGGPQEVDASADTEANKALVLEFTKQIRQGESLDRIGDFVAEGLIQHAPGIGAGRDGLADWLASEACGQYEMLFRVIGQGDFVVTYGKRHANGRDIAVFDLYRIAEGRIAEHWMNEEEIGPRDSWGNSGKF
ncbi:nuclear transport factor 2 family protein [Pseudoruegeria sp. SHC-113]|uniref:nuclear transport factor 2 family protein n=1 Tax=Pseudoruegeria sp. SHC-113 TaxID=2855439 RepID=UPI0021BB0C11|nr:nuclear transport factor 2 family protein [Pseudoruegeria sp. SHC-113]MCT8162202.1 nuclear transport factor 2 family protein [Pseudoruegeria sp. SHC-113]